MHFNCLFSYYACTFMLFAYLNLNMCTNKNFRNIYSGQCIDCSWVVTFEESVLKREENPLMIQFPHSHTPEVTSFIVGCLQSLLSLHRYYGGVPACAVSDPVLFGRPGALPTGV